jgi:FkbM family methyltransferase
VHRFIRQTITSIPVLSDIFYRARRRYHELRTTRAAKAYFVNYETYRQALHTRADGTVDVRTADGLTITIRRNHWDARILQEIFLTEPYLQDLSIPENATVVDIGGYIGDFSLYAAKRLKARKVIVYEPSPKNFEILLRNIENNHLQDRIVAINMAVSDSNEIMMDIDLPDSKQINVSAYGSHGTTPKHRVPSVTLPGLIESHKLELIDLLKIDCEGGEYAILLNTPSHTFDRIKNIVFEYHQIDDFQRKLEAVKNKLGAAGYWLKTHKGDVISASTR